MSFLEKTVLIKWNVGGLENSNIVEIKSVIMKYQKTSQKLSITIRKAVKVGADCPWYSETKKVKIFGMKKCKNNQKITCL